MQSEMSTLRQPSAVSWLQLLRLPNIFTAVADVMMGFLVTHGALQPVPHFTLLVAASCLLYLSGMVLNDVHDAELDARERPQRPIPSGVVPLATAAKFGWALWVSGVLAAWFVSFAAGDWRPGFIGTLLGACVVFYDFALKQAPIAPIVMGACRMLNVLLGMSLAHRASLATEVASPNGAGWESLRASGWTVTEWMIALGIGIYIAGVTWFARSEARASSRAQLIGGTSVLLAGIGLIASLPAWSDSDPIVVVQARGWYLLWAVLALIIARRCVLAILQPSPQRVQMAVRHCIHSIIVLDAAITLGYVGIFWGCAILLLIFPTLLLTFWLNAT